MNKIQHIEILEGMFSDATEGIIVSDSDGIIVLANRRAESMFGYDRDALFYLKIEDLVPMRFSHDHSELRKTYFDKPMPRSMGIGKDLAAKRKDGTEFPVEISLSYVKRDTNILVVAFIIDISERKRKDDELRQANELLKKTSFELSKLNMELEQKVQERTTELAQLINKLTESKREVDTALEKERELNNLKSRFISTASHEFRTPLATIMSSVSLTGKYAETMDMDKMMKHIERVKNSVNHLTDILNDFLSVDKLEEGIVVSNPEKIAFNHEMNEIVDQVRGIGKAGQKIVFVSLKGDDGMMMDKRILRNIMNNLLSNAMKYSNENTTIEIRPKITGNSIAIEIKDQGIGIPLSDQAHVFERFYRANNIGNVQGTGLGLNIVKKYVEILGGEISFKSIPEKGTTFTLNFPI